MIHSSLRPWMFWATLTFGATLAVAAVVGLTLLVLGWAQ